MDLKDILLRPDGGARELLDAAMAWLQGHPERLSAEHIPATTAILIKTRPAMAGFRELARRLENIPPDERPIRLAEWRAELAASDETIAGRLRTCLAARAPARLVTLSWSSTVLTALSRARDLIAGVHVLESWPGGEGIRFHRACAEFIREAILYPDAELETAAARAEVGVIGADTIFADGAVLNKVLSARLGRALARTGKPLLVLASRWKSSPQGSDTYAAAGTERELFEVVPGDWVSLIITEDARG